MTNLAGITVIDQSTVGPASRCTQILGDLGAQVIKVGPIGGDRWPPPWFTYGAGRDTQRARFDLKTAGGREAFLTLCATVDVVVESFRPGVADALGVGYEPLSERNPRVVYAATSGYGASGPYRDWAGHDLNYLAVGGFLATQGTRADGGPALPGATVADSAGGGMHAAIAILAALIARTSSGRGQFLDVSTVDGVLSLTSLNVETYLATGLEPRPGGNLLTGGSACYDLYQARDGRWLAVAAIEPKFFGNLCALLELPELAQHQMDASKQDEIRAALRTAFARRDRDEWIALLASKDTCVSPVLSIPEVFTDEHLRARGVFSEVTHPTHGTVGTVAPVIAGAQRRPAYTAPEADRTDTAELLRAAGVAADQIERWLADGVIA
jgi:alpha-methylacyl-CoA racemase